MTPPMTVHRLEENALVAQSAEHIHGKDGVIGSNPIEGWTISFNPRKKTTENIKRIDIFLSDWYTLCF